MRQNRWFHKWIDEYELHELSQVSNLLRHEKYWNRLVAFAHSHDREAEAGDVQNRSIVAGRALDLTAFLACGHADCLTRQIDDLFARVWHYFDRIYVVGADSHRFLEMVDSGDTKAAHSLAMGMAKVVLYAREVGADDYLVFVDKPPACGMHWPEFFDYGDLQLSDQDLSALVAEMMNKGQVQYKKTQRDPYFLYRGSGLWSGFEAVPADFVLSGDFESSMPVNERVVRTVLHRYHLGAASDLYASETLGLPIGAGLEMESRLLKSLRPTATEEQIAFNVRLPVVAEADITDLLEIRENEKEAFQAFRLGLSEAMRARLEMDGSKDPTEIARDVERDYLEPTIVDLQQRLEAASRVMTGKRLVHGGLAGLATVCGLLGIAPAAMALGGAALASSVPTELKAIETKADLQGSNMYFLWKVQHATGKKAPKKARRR